MRFKQTQIIALANQKGGCGKTTSSVSIASAFAALGYTAVIVDCDPQCNATMTFGVDADALYEAGKLNILDVFLKRRAASDVIVPCEREFFGGRLFVMPGNKQLGEVGQHLELEAIMGGRFQKAEIDYDQARDEHRTRLRESLRSLRGKVDVVIIDTPPNLGYLMTTALVAADWFIIPVFPSRYELEGLDELTMTVSKIRSKYNPDLKLAGVLLGHFDKRTKLDRDVYDLLVQKYGADAVFKTVITTSVVMRRLTFLQQTIFEYEGTTAQAGDFMTLVKEMIARAMKTSQSLEPLPELDQVIDRSKESGIDLTKALSSMSEVANG